MLTVEGVTVTAGADVTTNVTGTSIGDSNGPLVGVIVTLPVYVFGPRPPNTERAMVTLAVLGGAPVGGAACSQDPPLVVDVLTLTAVDCPVTPSACAAGA